MIRKLIEQKKGDVFQVLFLIVLIFAVAVVGLLCLVLTLRVNEFWDESGLLNETEAGTAAIETMTETAPRTTDYAIFFLFLGMNIGVIIAAVRTNFSAAVIFLFILLTLIAIMMSAGMVNMYQGLAQQPSIIDVSSIHQFSVFNNLNPINPNTNINTIIKIKKIAEPIP